MFFVLFFLVASVPLWDKLAGDHNWRRLWCSLALSEYLCGSEVPREREEGKWHWAVPVERPNCVVRARELELLCSSSSWHWCGVRLTVEFILQEETNKGPLLLPFFLLRCETLERDCIFFSYFSIRDEAPSDLYCLIDTLLYVHTNILKSFYKVATAYSMTTEFFVSECFKCRLWNVNIDVFFKLMWLVILVHYPQFTATVPLNKWGCLLYHTSYFTVGFIDVDLNWSIFSAVFHIKKSKKCKVALLAWYCCGELS